MSTIVVTTGGDPVVNGVNFQGALDTCACGDIIILQAGAVYQGANLTDQAFLLKYKAGCSEYITIQTSNLAGISADGVRIDPAIHEAAMPKVMSDSSAFGSPVIRTELNANHYKLIGINITTNGIGYAPNLVTLKPSATSSYADLIGTHDFIFDRCFIHTAEIDGSNLFPSASERSSGRGIAADGVEISIINSYIAGFTGFYPETETLIDSYGVYIERGPGPIHIVNNYIEAMFNNIFSGGGNNYTLNSATVTNPTLTSATLSNVANLQIDDLIAFPYGADWQVGQVTGIAGNDVTFTIIEGLYSPTPDAPDVGGTAGWNGINVHDVEIRRNTLNKLDAWNAYADPKAWIEIKDGVDIVIDGNTMYSGIGTTLALTARNQNGSTPWATIENLTYSNNVAVGFKVAVMSHLSDSERASVPCGNWTLRNNLWYTPKNSPTGNGVVLQIGPGLLGGHDVFITHNTVIQPDHIVASEGATGGQFVFNDNIVNNGEYGMQCYLPPNDLPACFPGLDMTGNVIVGPALSGRPSCTDHGGIIYPAGNNCVDSFALVGFTDLDNHNYRLAPTSPYKGLASDDTDPGVDMDELLAALGGEEAATTLTFEVWD